MLKTDGFKTLDQEIDEYLDGAHTADDIPKLVRMAKYYKERLDRYGEVAEAEGGLPSLNERDRRIEWFTTCEQCANHYDQLTDQYFRIERALEVINRFSQIPGDHHKAWVIDQAVRHLTGDGYDSWVARSCDGEDGPDTYEWDTGIAP